MNVISGTQMTYAATAVMQSPWCPHSTSQPVNYVALTAAVVPVVLIRRKVSEVQETFNQASGWANNLGGVVGGSVNQASDQASCQCT
jgi:hypothetical protein